MEHFANQFIAEEKKYHAGLCEPVPDYRKTDTAILLVDGIHDDIIVNEYTSSRQIRKGKYKKIVEISTRPYTTEINLKSSSKEMTYFYDVYIKVVIQVKNPKTCYENRNLDIESYVQKLVSISVKKITRKYSIMDSSLLEEDLNSQLAGETNEEGELGIIYRISTISAQFDHEAEKYVQTIEKQKLDAEAKRIARALKDQYTENYREAIMTQVAEGKLTEVEAIKKIAEYKDEEIRKLINNLNESIKNGLIKESEAREIFGQLLSEKHIENTDFKEAPKAVTMRKFYQKEEEE